jgi:hypothetical protein
MQYNRRSMLISSFFVILSVHEDIAEKVIRSTAAKMDPPVTREEIAEVRQALYAHPEWAPAEFELYRILDI